MSENKVMRRNPWTNSDVELLQGPPLVLCSDGSNMWTASSPLLWKMESELVYEGWSNWKSGLSSSVLCVDMTWNSPFEALKFVALGWCKQLTRNPGTLLLDLCRKVSPQLSIPCLTPLDFYSWKTSLICSICLVQSGTWLKGCAEHKTPQLQLQLNFSWAWISVWWAEGSSYLWLGWNLGM